jgi:hypothetical protein
MGLLGPDSEPVKWLRFCKYSVGYALNTLKQSLFKKEQEIVIAGSNFVTKKFARKFAF